MEQAFIFADRLTDIACRDDFLIAVPRGIQTRKELLAIYERIGRFPGYFGGNWDAFLDCLRDFSWISERRIVIAHSDLPLSADNDGARIYLEILATAVNDWHKPKAGPFAEPPLEMHYVEHEVVVVFPTELRKTINHLPRRSS
jgi:hypothetical protein